MVFLEGKGMCGYVSHGSTLRKVLFGLIVSLKAYWAAKIAHFTPEFPVTLEHFSLHNFLNFPPHLALSSQPQKSFARIKLIYSKG